MAAANDTKIIGYFAYATPTEVFCDGEGKKYTVKKTRFGEVMRGMRLGAVKPLAVRNPR